jgi:hypothetical protein
LRILTYQERYQIGFGGHVATGGCGYHRGFPPGRKPGLPVSPRQSHRWYR